jgi:hypothetical protein
MRGEVHLVQLDPTDDRRRDSGDATFSLCLQTMSISAAVGVRRARSTSDGDRERLVKRLGTLPSASFSAVLSGLQEMFAE